MTNIIDLLETSIIKSKLKVDKLVGQSYERERWTASVFANNKYEYMYTRRDTVPLKDTKKTKFTWATSLKLAVRIVLYIF